MRSMIIAAAALAGATAALPAAAQEAGGSYRLTGGRVAIYNLAGRVTVEPGGGDAVAVTVTPGGADAGRLTVRSGEVRGRTALRVVYPADRIVYTADGFRGRTELRVRDDGTFGDGGDRREGDRVTVSDRGNGLAAHADLTIRVPPGRDVAIHQAVGAVRVRNVDGRLLIDGHSASVDATGTRGSLAVDLGSGSVTVREAQGRVDVDTGSGDVVLEGAAGDAANIDTGSGNVRATGVRARELTLDTGSGDVILERITADRVRIDTGSGAVRIALVSAPSDLVIDTGSGSVTVEAPAALGSVVQIETGSGSIDTDFPVTIRRHARNQLNGTIGDGSGRIVIDTGSGDVRLLRR